MSRGSPALLMLAVLVATSQGCGSNRAVPRVALEETLRVVDAIGQLPRHGFGHTARPQAGGDIGMGAEDDEGIGVSRPHLPELFPFRTDGGPGGSRRRVSCSAQVGAYPTYGR